MKRCFIFLGIVLFLFFSVTLCMAKVLVVSNVEEFQNALTEAATNTEHDIIKIAPGIYQIPETLTYFPSTLQCNRAPCITHGDITIEPQDENNRPLLDGGNNTRIMVLETYNNGDRFCGKYFNGELFCGEKITIRGLIFQNGKANDDNYYGVGGLYAAALNSRGQVTLEDCKFIDNERKNDVSNAHGGGASLLASGSIIAKNNEFFRNVGKYGGGLYCNGPSTVENNIFEENEAYKGGGFYGPTNSLYLTKNIFRNNHAFSGGGAFTGSWEDQHLNILDNIFENNSAKYTGALYVGVNAFSNLYVSGYTNIIENAFINNQSQYGYGGAVRLTSTGRSNVIMNNIFYRNISGNSSLGTYRHGGALYAWISGGITIINNTISDNLAAQAGGGVYVQKNTYEYAYDDWVNKKISIYNNIIWRNTANNGGTDGDDVYVEVLPSNDNHIYGPVYVYNNILGENSNIETGISEDYVVNYRYSNGEMDRYHFGGNLLENPLLIDPANSDFHLDPRSPAINAGENSILPTYPDSDELIFKTDFEGDPRIIYEIVDIGADEYNGAAHQFSLNVDKVGEGSGTISSDPEGIFCGDTCSASFDGGQEVTLTANADEGSQFTGWSGDCSNCDGETCTITMDSNKSCTANFQEVVNRSTPDLVITKIVTPRFWYWGRRARVTVLVENQGDGDITEPFTVSLYATPDIDLGQATINGLSAGSRKLVRFTFNSGDLSSELCTSGTHHTLHAVSDPEDLISESDDTNNEATKNIIMRRCP